MSEIEIVRTSVAADKGGDYTYARTELPFDTNVPAGERKARSLFRLAVSDLPIPPVEFHI